MRLEPRNGVSTQVKQIAFPSDANDFAFDPVLGIYS